MGLRLLKDTWNIFRELRELKKYAPEIISAFKYFDRGENPQKARKKIIDTAKRNPALDDLLKVIKTDNMISRAEKRAEEKDWNYACQEAVKEMDVNYEVRGRENIPANGRTLYISNHPYGLLDSAILLGGLGSLVSKEKRKLKIIVMDQLRFIKGLEEVVYFVHSTVKGPNMGSLRESLKYLSNGGDLAIYPSGRMSKAGLEEYPWKNLRIFLSFSSCVVPMWFSGPDHAKIYNFLATFKKTEQARRVFSLREIWNKKGETVILNIGKPISSKELIRPKKPEEKKTNGEIVKKLKDEAKKLKVTV